MSAVTINKSVGRNGVNHYEDVLKVQTLLNKFISGWQLDVEILVLDGLCGNKTRTAIGIFQSLFLGHKNPDRRVDPGEDKPTLKALNGPLDQPKLGDPHDTTQRAVQRVLRDAHVDNIRFTLGDDSFTPQDFHAVASRFETRFLRAFHDPSQGDNAQYFHANDGDRSRGTMLVGFLEASGSFQKSVVIHEATHAVCDARATLMITDRAEAIAHLAQALYYRSSTGHNLSVGNAQTTDVLSHCGNIAVRMKMDATTVVREEDHDRLIELVRRLPSVNTNAGFFYDGI